MVNGIILYKSKYGATKQYAQWLAEETGFSCEKTDDVDINEVSKYDIIILGGGIYASGIAGLSFLKKNIEKLKDKKVIVFCCGASPFEQNAFNEIIKHNMKGKIENIPCFYCRGKFDMSTMTLKDKTLFKILRKALSRKNPNEYAVWESALMSVKENEKGNWTDKSYLKPILKELNINMP